MLRLIFCAALACGPRAIPGTQVQMDFTRHDGFFTAPFPSEELKSMSGFPDRRIDLVQKALTLARPSDGFSTSGGVHFSLTGPLDPELLPDAAGSVKPDATVFLVALDTLQRHAGGGHFRR